VQPVEFDVGLGIWVEKFDRRCLKVRFLRVGFGKMGLKTDGEVTVRGGHDNMTEILVRPTIARTVNNFTYQAPGKNFFSRP
jgi:hypothetical protein